MQILNLHDINYDPAKHTRIDRMSYWGNPYKMTSERDRLQVIWKYVFYILDKTELLDRIDLLQDCTLACWCHPLPCHGDVLKYLAYNPHVIARYQAGNLTKESIAQDIFRANGWNVPKVSRQVTLF